MVNGEYTDENGKKQFEEGRVQEIKDVSDYFYYALDSWGKDNPESQQPQC